MKINVLDDGFVCLVDVMGDDSSIVQAARISYGAGTKTVSEDEKLIRYLMKHEHTSPFEMVELKFHIRLPMDVMRQLVRHRTASINEYSTRYSEAIDSFYRAAPVGWRLQATTNKQGSGDYASEDLAIAASEGETRLYDEIRTEYQWCLANGIAREQARKHLPLCTYTEIYWKIDLRNLFHFLKLRMAPAAQFEIREYANAIFNIVKERVPLATRAFEDYCLNAVTFSKQEMEAMRNILKWNVGINDAALQAGLDGRELTEFLEKLEK